MVGARSSNALLHFQREALRVAVEFGGVHALDFGDAGLVAALELDTRGIFKHVNSLGQVIDEEVAGGGAREFE